MIIIIIINNNNNNNSNNSLRYQNVLQSFELRFSQLAIDVSSHMKLMHTRTDSPRFDSALRNKG